MNSLETLQRMIQFDSRTETATESDITRYLADRLKENGFESHLHEAEPGRLNAIGVWPGTDGGPSLMFNGHVDTNHVGRGWTVDPWEGYVDDSFIYGIGVSNMKAGCAAYLSAAEELKEEGFQPKSDLILTFVVGELQNGVGTHAMVQDGWTADYFINCEPTDLQALTLHAGAINFEIELRGLTRHLSKREEAVDVVPALSELIPRLNTMQFSGAVSSEHESINRCHVGVVKAGIGEELSDARPPQAADYAILSGSARFAPSQSLDSVLRDLEAQVAAIQKLFPGLEADVRRLVTRDGRPYFSPFEVDPEAYIVQELNTAWTDVRGTAQNTGTIFPCSYFGSDAAHLAEAGIEGVVCGPGGKYNTMPDERVELEDYFDAVKIYKNVITQICG